MPFWLLSGFKSLRDKCLPLSANVLIDLSNDIAIILGNTGDEGFCIKNNTYQK